MTNILTMETIINRAIFGISNETKNAISIPLATGSLPWIPEAPRETEKRDLWFHEACSCFTHPVRSQYPNSEIFCDWSNLER